MAIGSSRFMGAFTGLIRVPPGCSRPASSMRRASKPHAANVAVVATYTPRIVVACVYLSGSMLDVCDPKSTGGQVSLVFCWQVQQGL